MPETVCAAESITNIPDEATKAELSKAEVKKLHSHLGHVSGEVIWMILKNARKRAIPGRYQSRCCGVFLRQKEVQFAEADNPLEQPAKSWNVHCHGYLLSCGRNRAQAPIIVDDLRPQQIYHHV